MQHLTIPTQGNKMYWHSVRRPGCTSARGNHGKGDGQNPHTGPTEGLASAETLIRGGGQPKG